MTPRSLSSPLWAFCLLSALSACPNEGKRETPTGDREGTARHQPASRPARLAPEQPTSRRAQRPRPKMKPGPPAFPLSARRFDLSKPAVGGVAAPATRGPLPPLWAMDTTTLRLLVVKRGKLETRFEVDLSPYRRNHRRHARVLVAPRGQLLAVTDSALLMLDERRKPHVVWSARKGSELAAAALAGTHVLVASEGGLIVLDRRFREVGRLHFGLRAGKEAHDILVVGQRALLLDNIYRPLVVFVVDISKPTQPRVVHRIDGGGVYPHLDYQWYDRSAKRWGILARGRGRCGGHQTVHLIDPHLPAQPTTKASGPSYARAWRHPAVKGYTTTWSRTTPTCRKPRERQLPEEQGTRWIAGASEAPDALFVTEDGIRLSRFRIADEKVSVGKGALVAKLPPCIGRGRMRPLLIERRRLRVQLRRGVEARQAARMRRQMTKLGEQIKRSRQGCSVRRNLAAGIDAREGWVVTAALSKLTFWRRRGSRIGRVQRFDATRYRVLRLLPRSRSVAPAK